MINLKLNKRGKKAQKGFTLIELSIVLVIIGLIVGGVLVGQDLIRAAEVRATISQIEKYNTATNTFRSKFNAIPGDMSLTTALQFGFTTGTSCTGSTGKRDGNGLIDSYSGTIATLAQGSGEAELYWVDISSNSAGNLVDGTFVGAGTGCGTPVATSSTQLSNYFPSAKLGRGAYIYVYETNGFNYFGISPVSGFTTAGALTSGVSLSVLQAYNIDKKIDDGLPLTGNTMASFVSGAAVVTATSTATTGGTVSSCFDTSTSTYSVSFNNGAGGNCALSVQFQ